MGGRAPATLTSSLRWTSILQRVLDLLDCRLILTKALDRLHRNDVLRNPVDPLQRVQPAPSGGPNRTEPVEKTQASERRLAPPGLTTLRSNATSASIAARKRSI